ncbi:MAG: BatA domain-containing protein [Akkermansiaceae bacterium]|nr:BatA domain-containing protein [Akkermansiaceae bacterium]
MSFTLANLAGLWALLGIPAVLAIHFLQRQSRVETVSTLFLLDQLRRESVSGRRFERLRSSIPLWLQLLLVLILTWLLVEPRWVRPDSVRRIAVVLDGSASMSAFRGRLAAELSGELGKPGPAGLRTEYVVLDSRTAGEPVYNGSSLTDMLAAIAETWRPTGGDHDFGPSLRIGRSLAGPKGLVVLATDHLVDRPPYRARLLAVGEPRENVGFAGLEVARNDDGEWIWLALVRNYADTARTRRWFMRAGPGQRTAEREISLAPGEIRTLQGRFPEDSGAAVLHLEPDDFDVDDRLPLLRPEPKPFSIAVASPVLNEAFSDILASFENLAPPPPDGAPDLALAAYEPLNPAPLPERTIAFVHHPNAAREFETGPIVAENHPLMTGLNWQGLIARRSPGIPVRAEDTVLLWQAERALVFLNTSGGARQLCFNFDLTTSNAARLPAFVVLLHRFVDGLREAKVAPESKNVETAQALAVAADSSAENAPPLEYRREDAATGDRVTETIPLERATLLRAPDTPGFVEIQQGDALLLRAAVAFADTREADLRNAASRSDLAGVESEVIEEHTDRDAHWRLWLLAGLAALLASWYFLNRPRPAANAMAGMGA